ncbi:Signal transduction histidine kinase [Eubacterium ruminantium]|nr:Signal transduction histidine kinase [Eubacterium ruminantium]
MENDKNKRLYEKGITAVKILLCFMLALNAVVFVYYGMINRGVVKKSDPIRYIKDWTVTDDEKGDQLVTGVLPQKIDDNEFLYFDTRKDVSVYIDGILRKDFVEKRDVNIPGGSFTKFLFSVPLTENDSGAEVIVVRKELQEIDKDIPEFFIGTRFGALSHLFRTVGLSFILSFIILIFSFVALVVSVVLRLWYKQRIDMTYGALGIFIISAWLITDSYLFPIVFGVYFVNGLLTFMFCLMIPLVLLVYLSAIQRGRYRKFTSFAGFVAILNAVIWPLLHFSKVLPFYNVRTLANATLILLSASGIVILVVDAVRRKNKSYHYTFVGFLGFLIGCIIELSTILFAFKISKESIPIVVGLGFLLTFIVIQQVHDLRMINMEKKHAIDISEAKTRFLASMSHEIRTPINAILGMNEMILRENNDKAVEEYSRNIKTSGKMLLMLVNDVLDFSKIESGKLEIRESGFLMSEMLYDVISLVKEMAEEKDLGLTAEITDEVPNELISDEFRIRQILVNLMNNAVKYTDSGTITLKVGGKYTEDGYLLSLFVKDPGRGIRKEDQEHLFEAFSRADVKSNANIEGTGLGLAIVKSIVDSMNGELGVESEFGVGSEFRVKLPVKYKNKEPLRKDFLEHKPVTAAVNSESSFIAPEAKVLVVDDNQSNLTIVKLFLKKNSIVPDLCTTGKRAIELCKEKKYDLILMDHMMPQPDGIETLHIIRNDEESLNKDTKAVVLTANAVAGSRQMYISEGFDDYLTKPLDSGVLEETVKKMLPKDKVNPDGTNNTGTNDIGVNNTGTNNTGASNDSTKTSGSIYDNTKEKSSFRERISAIDGFDYDTALRYCGGEEELLQEIISDAAGECREHVDRMRKSLEEKDLNIYRIEAHTIKGTMATIGIQKLSDRARKHEFAARDGDVSFIHDDAEDFISEYIKICRELREV